ncbi:MAG TPA: hypothetical protein VFG69_09085 [Nannocystaceae bacterium]|nr:hypothetical protein [Nannocystaceae bacterium]
MYVFSTHHATPEDGMFPDRGGEDMPRTFPNDMGWTVTLLESYITITSLTAVACDGTAYPLEMFFGPCPEDIRETDLDLVTVGGRKMPEGAYCQLVVGYGPYESPDVDVADEENLHAVPTTTDIDGTTVFMTGGAFADPEAEDEAVEFELRMGKNITVELDLSTIDDGLPLQIAAKEDFPVELTVSKTYDRFLDGVDFATLDEEDVEDELDNRLREATRIQPGRQVLMFDAD